MKQYRFRLQTVLDYRTEQLNRIQQRVAEAEHIRLAILNRIQEYDTVIETAIRRQQQAMHEGPLDLMQMQAFPDYLWRLKQNRFQEFQALQRQDQALQALREELKQALIKKKALEILKDKDQIRYRKQIEKAEEAFLAELAINRHHRSA